MNSQGGGWLVEVGSQGDLPAVLALWCASNTAPSTTASTAALQRLLDRDPGALLVARAEGEVIGSLVVGWDGWRANFYRLAVAPGWRRRGVASALIDSGVERARRLGAARLAAIVSDADRGAASFWEAAGFRRESDSSRFVRMV